MSNSLVPNIEYVVYVDPRAYAHLATSQEKLAVGRLVGRINRELAGKRYALFGPGRWGSNDINLGVKVGYPDINNTLILGEISFGEEGSAPEVSYGTHFFNDLVESGIVPIGIYPDLPENLLREDFLLNAPNQVARFAPSLPAPNHVVHVIHVPSCTGEEYLHVIQDGKRQKGIGFFAPKGEGERMARPSLPAPATGPGGNLPGSIVPVS